MIKVQNLHDNLREINESDHLLGDEDRDDLLNMTLEEL
jgi:hypothetical protein